MLIFQGFANSRIVREFPPFSFKVRIATLTRNQVVAQAARGFESHPIRHIAGAKFALLRLFAVQKHSKIRTKHDAAIFLTGVEQEANVVTANYSPDLAIAFYEGKVKHIFFIAETKGTMESLELRPIEQAKISCAKKLFNEMSTSNVVYHDVDSYQSLLNIMNSL